MHRFGHLGVGLLFAAFPTAVLFGAGFPFAGIGLAAFCISTCRLPDEAESIPGIGHRTITHTVLFTLGVGVVASLGVTGLFVATRDVLPIDRIVYVSVPIGAMLGVVSHLAADALTVGRGNFAIKPFWPVSKRTVRLGLVKSGNTVANVGLLIGGGITFAVCLYLGLRTSAFA
jgi:inner membrane protein